MREALVDEVEQAFAAKDLGRAWRCLSAAPAPLDPDEALLLSELDLALGTEATLADAARRLPELLAAGLSGEAGDWARLLLGAVLSCQGEDAAARPHFERALAAHPGWREGEYGAAYAACLIELEAFEAAAEALAPVAARDPEALAVRAMQARWLRRQDRPDEALVALDLGSPREADAGIAFEAACAFAALGQSTESRTWAARARRAQPTWYARALAMEPARFRPEKVEG